MKENSLITGSITKSLLKFTFPIILALILQSMYSAVDMLIVGNFGTVADVSGVSTGSQFIMTLTSLCTGLAMGITILIGKYIGENRREEVGQVVTNGTAIFTLLALILTLSLLLFAEPLMHAMNVPTDALEQTRSYLFYCSLGIPMIYAYNVLGSIFRGLGDSKTPLMSVAIACVVNIVVDLILVAGFGMGASGAAIATVLAQTTSVLISLYVIHKKKLLEGALVKADFKCNPNVIKAILKLGSPVALQSVIVTFSFLVVTIVVNQFGVVFSASVGVVEKITGIIMLVPIAFMQSMSVFVAQNWGAKAYDRARKGLFIGMGVSFAFGAVMAYISVFHGDSLIRLFNQDPEIIATATTYLNAYAIDACLVPIMFCLTGYFNGRGQTFFVMVQGIVGSVVLRVPFTYLLSLVEPTSLFTIGLATPLATLIQIPMNIGYYIYHTKKFKKDQETVSTHSIN